MPKSSLFHALLDSELPTEEKSPGRLSQEVFTVISAGEETTAKNLSTLTLNLLNNPDKLQRLREELSRLDPNGTASLVEYETMAYLVCFDICVLFTPRMVQRLTIFRHLSRLRA